MEVEHIDDDDSMDSEDSDASYNENDNLRSHGGTHLGSLGTSKAFCKGHWSKEEVINSKFKLIKIK